MNLKRLQTILLVAGAFGLALARPVLADGGQEASGVSNRKGDASPPAGFSSTTTGIGSSTETTTWSGSNVDDYTHQDDQINIDGSKDALIKVLRANQKVLFNDFTPAVYPIRNASPIEIRNAFRLIAAAEGGRAEVIRDQEKKQNFLFVLAPAWQHPHIQSALEAVDQPWVQDNVDGSVDGYYNAKFRNVVDVTTLARIGASAAVNSADDNLIKNDTVANRSVITGEPYRVKSFLQYAAVVDQPLPELLLEATVYEVEVSNEKRLGLDYMAWKNGPGRNLFQFAAWGFDAYMVADNVVAIFDPFFSPRHGLTGDAGTNRYEREARGTYTSTNFLLNAAYIDWLEGSGRARVVTRGKLIIRNGRTGTLSATDQVLHFLVDPDDGSSSTSASATSETYPASGVSPTLATTNTQVPYGIPIHNRVVDKDQFINVGFDMNVTPWIGELTTELAVTMAVNNIVGQTPGGTPQVRTHELTSTVLVRDGGEFCLTGLRRTEDVRQTQKVPILGSLPIIGWLFGHEATVKRETEMVVVLRPRIRLGAQADFELARDEDEQIRRMALKTAKLTLPRTEFGFDQWLLDGTR